MVTGAVHIGTSGWHYKHWRGPFYPEKLAPGKMLGLYTQHFDTVELNTTFYRLPTVGSPEQWRDSTPANFCFAAKGSRFLTHMKKLKDPEQGIERFFERIEPLSPKLGPIVFQLPPFWEIDAKRLEAFLQALPQHHQYSFELRNSTWHTPEVYRILHRYNVAYCIYEIAGFQSPVKVTADFVYIRLHGPGGAYQGSYPPETLRLWADRIQKWRKSLRSIYVYFDNDQAAFAVRNALDLKELTAERRSITPQRAQSGKLRAG
jgi:uncharacterized protein YecE (DUF72 family)